MNCQFFDHPDRKDIDIRPTEDGTWIRGRSECLQCEKPCYKCFNKNFKTNTGITLYLGKIYTTEQYPAAKQTGYHFCKNLEVK